LVIGLPKHDRAALLGPVQFDFFQRLFRPKHQRQESVVLGSRTVPIRFFRNRHARRYILRVTPDGAARVTIPRGGTQTEARNFLQRHLAWLEDQLQKPRAQPCSPETWTAGTEILFRGERARIVAGPNGEKIQFADQTVSMANPASNLRPAIERHLWRLAAEELVVRTCELVALHQLTVRRITVRDQRSRWGSCSIKGTISLNWRLIQTPDFVRDYIILHELMHLREMNHSRRYWNWVEKACPNYRDAEAWLKQHKDLLR
jgi:predicted metal-dependent hydrolase